jgi:acetyltransferase-like isoleucine patch superfamily enzyme
MDFSSKDYNGIFFKIIRLLNIRLNSFISSMFCISVARLKKVNVGHHTKFNGITIFYRKPSTKIEIGNNCQFISNFNTNLVGVNRQCIVATHSDFARIQIGNGCGFSGTVIGAAESIIIGNNVFFGANTLVTDFDWHAVDPEHRKTGKPKSAPIVIEDNVWVGINAVVLKGVTIGQNSIIGANSLVVKDIPANVIAGGNPCQVIKPIE